MKKSLDLSIKTIFRDCFDFKKKGLVHPIRKTCDKYQPTEYEKFFKWT